MILHDEYPTGCSKQTAQDDVRSCLSDYDEYYIYIYIILYIHGIHDVYIETRIVHFYTTWCVKNVTMFI